jgi:glycosyltransferase involved in cell wall biosynthesis
VKICLVTSEYPPFSHYGGIGTRSRNMALGFAAAGHAVHVVAAAERGATEVLWRREGGITIHRILPPIELFRGSWRLRPIFSRTHARLCYSRRVNEILQELCRRREVDVVLASEWGAEALWFALFQKRTPLVITIAGPSFLVHAVDGLPASLDGRLAARLEHLVLLRGDRLHAVSDNAARLVRTRYGLKRPTCVIRSPVDTEFFRPTPNGTAARAPPRVLYVGRLQRLKGVEVLARAIPLVHRTHPAAEFVLAGADCRVEGQVGSSMQERLRGLLGASADRVRFAGALPRHEVVEEYRRSTLCVFPSLAEPFANVGLEAAACAKPVIATEGTGFVELIEHRVNGLLVPPGSVESLRDALVELLDDAALRERLGGRAREHVERRHAIPVVAERWMALLGECVRRG